MDAICLDSISSISASSPDSMSSMRLFWRQCRFVGKLNYHLGSSNRSVG